MKNFKVLMTLLGCLMLSFSTDAMQREESDDLAERLGGAACMVLNMGYYDAFEPYRQDYERSEEISRSLYGSQATNLSKDEKLETLRELQAIKKKIGEGFISDPSPIMQAIPVILSAEFPMDTAWPYHYIKAFLLLENLGVSEEQRHTRKEDALSIIKDTLQADRENVSMLGLLFKYFLPDDRFALDRLSELERKVQTIDRLNFYNPAERHSSTDIQLLELGYRIKYGENVRRPGLSSVAASSFSPSPVQASALSAAPSTHSASASAGESVVASALSAAPSTLSTPVGESVVASVLSAALSTLPTPVSESGSSALSAAPSTHSSSAGESVVASALSAAPSTLPTPVSESGSSALSAAPSTHSSSAGESVVASVLSAAPSTLPTPASESGSSALSAAPSTLSTPTGESETSERS